MRNTYERVYDKASNKAAWQFLLMIIFVLICDIGKGILGVEGLSFLDTASIVVLFFLPWIHWLSLSIEEILDLIR